MQFSPNTRCTAEELVRNEHWDGQVIPFVFCVSRQGFGVREVSDRGTLGNNIKQIPLCGFFQQLVIRHEFACEPLLSQRQLFYLGSSLTNDLREQFTTVIRKKKNRRGVILLQHYPVHCQTPSIVSVGFLIFSHSQGLYATSCYQGSSDTISIRTQTDLKRSYI